MPSTIDLNTPDQNYRKESVKHKAGAIYHTYYHPNQNISGTARTWSPTQGPWQEPYYNPYIEVDVQITYIPPIHNIHGSSYEL